MANRRSYTDDQLTAAVSTSQFWADVMEKLGFPRARGAANVKEAAARLGLDTAHLDKRLAPSRQVISLSPARNPSGQGAVTEAVILAALAKAGKTVLIPFGDGHRYDLAIDEAGTLVRVQCKTATYQGGCVLFGAYSLRRDGSKRSYDGDADLFAVYAPALDKVYLVPVEDVSAGSEGRLRVDQSRNNQSAGIRMAADYELRS